MIRGANLKKLLAVHMDPTEAAKRNQGRIANKLRPFAPGVRGYAQEVRELVGITESEETGRPTFSRAGQSVKAQEVDLAEVAHELIGDARKDPAFLRAAFDPARRAQVSLMEAEGGVVLPSHFANVSAFTDTVSGLIDVMTLEAYENPIFIGDEFVEVKESRVQGGKEVGVRGDGGVSENLTANEPYPTVGAYETFVHIPDNQRYGNVIQLNEQVFIYDRTDQVQGLARIAGEGVRRNREVRIADMVLGKVNSYSRDGLNTNTYRITKSTATTNYDNAGPRSPNNYVNSKLTQPLNSWSDWNVAKQLLSRNIDPSTGWEILNDPRESILLVSPDNELLARTIVQATGIQTRSAGLNAMNTASLTQATSVQLDVRNSSNPLAEYGIRILSSRIWYNRLLLAGTNASNTPSGGNDVAATDILDGTVAMGDSATKAYAAWGWGAPKRAFRYRQIKPFQTAPAPLSSEDARRNIVAIYISEEWGVPYVHEPRHFAMLGNVWTA